MFLGRYQADHGPRVASIETIDGQVSLHKSRGRSIPGLTSFPGLEAMSSQTGERSFLTHTKRELQEKTRLRAGLEQWAWLWYSQ